MIMLFCSFSANKVGNLHNERPKIDLKRQLKMHKPIQIKIENRTWSYPMQVIIKFKE